MVDTLTYDIKVTDKPQGKKLCWVQIEWNNLAPVLVKHRWKLIQSNNK